MFLIDLIEFSVLFMMTSDCYAVTTFENFLHIFIVLFLFVFGE